MAGLCIEQATEESPGCGGRRADQNDGGDGLPTPAFLVDLDGNRLPLLGSTELIRLLRWAIRRMPRASSAQMACTVGPSASVTWWKVGSPEKG
jgi:hypothetical protein